MAKSAPPQPDYTGAANAQGAASMWNTQYQTLANRPDINTPWGSVSWNRPNFVDPYAGASGTGYGGGGSGGGGGPGPNPLGVAAGAFGGMFGGGGGGGVMDMFRGGREGSPQGGIPGQSGSPNFSQGFGDPWSMNLTLSPQQQAALDAQQAIQKSRSDLAQGIMGQVGGTLSKPVDWSSVPGLVSGEDARKQAFDATYGQAASRLDPQWQARSDAFSNELANQGILPGSQQYQIQMDQFNRARNDAYQSAINNATQYGEQAAQGLFGRSLAGHQQGLADLLQQRGQGFNEMQALLGGEQVGMPQMPGFAQAGQAAAPNYLGAAQAGYGASMNQYNAQQMQLQGLMQGGMDVASLAMMF